MMMQFIKKNRTFVLGLLALLVAVYMWGVKGGKIEFMKTAGYPWDKSSPASASSPVPTGVVASVETSQQQAGAATACDPANFASVSLIPETNDVIRDEAFEFAPSPEVMLNKDFSLDSAAKYGENTQGSSLRNANRQLRSEPANSRTVVSPWMNSTIEPDLLRLPLE